MSELRNWKHEQVAQALAIGKSPDEAAAQLDADGKPLYDVNGSSFRDNARKLAYLPHIRRRVAELQAMGARKAEESIGVTIEWILWKLRNLAEYNIDDYLTPADEMGHRHIDVARASRELLGRISELSEDTTAGGAIRRTRIKGYDPIAAMALMAKILGAAREESESAIDRLGDRLDRAISRTTKDQARDDPSRPPEAAQS